MTARYPKQVFWSDEDEGFIAIAPDLPGCSAFGESEAAAVSELDPAIEAWIDAARVAGNAVPAPSNPASRGPYSGKVLVRMPRSLHRDLAEAAKREEVSLNQFVVFVLSKHTAASPEREVAGSWVTIPASVSRNFSGSAVNLVSGAFMTRSANSFGLTYAAGGADYWVKGLANEMTLYDEHTKFMMDGVLALSSKQQDDHIAE